MVLGPPQPHLCPGGETIFLTGVFAPLKRGEKKVPPKKIWGRALNPGPEFKTPGGPIFVGGAHNHPYEFFTTPGLGINFVAGASGLAQATRQRYQSTEAQRHRHAQAEREQSAMTTQERQYASRQQTASRRHRYRPTGDQHSSQ